MTKVDTTLDLLPLCRACVFRENNECKKNIKMIEHSVDCPEYQNEL
jgi:hypothetical protein